MMKNIKLTEKIKELKEAKNAVILAHNYQLPEIQDIADYTGDSLGLSIQAAKTSADIIVFCGVYFMAETAKILSPEKTVLLPDINAGCPMADMITEEDVRKLKAINPKAKIVCYVNTSAAVKAESDVCCTSANAVDVAKALVSAGEEIIFIPDKYLANYVYTQIGHDFAFWNGYCPTHLKIRAKEIAEFKELRPKAEVLVHPECNSAVISLADYVCSTDGICKRAKQSPAKEIIVGTEIGILYRLQKENPGKIFYPASKTALCPNMKRINLEKVLWALEDMQHEITVFEDIASRARQSIQCMLEITTPAAVR